MSSTLGHQLKTAREARYITLEKAADETRIRRAFLQALEADDYSIMPSAAQGRGFLRNYASYLEIDIDEAIAELQRDPPPAPEMSGPLPAVNLLESEPPPLTDSVDEKRAGNWIDRIFAFWTSIRPRRKQADAPLEQESQSPAALSESAPPAQEMPVEAAPAEVRPALRDRINVSLRKLFQVRFRRSESPGPQPGVAPEQRRVETPSEETPEMIFVEVGKKLRERREMLSLNIDEVERHTHMRSIYIRALEEGAIDKLPSPVQTRGLLAMYAGFLDLDADTILLRFADAIQARHRQKYFETPREKIQTEVITSMPLLRSFIAGDLIFGVLMVAIIFLLAVWGVARVLTTSAFPTAQATAPSIVQVLAGSELPSPTVEATFLPVNDVPLATGVQPNATAGTLAPNANVTITLFAVERTFVRVFVDGQTAFDGRMAPRDTQIFQAEQQIEILTGNAAALRISYNGRDLGLLGNVGEVISRIYTTVGVVTPTSTIPPSPTPTPSLFLTPTVTRTPTATATP